MSVPRKKSKGADKAGAAPFTGDFALGTFADSAHGTFLRPGDIVESEVHGLGRQQNRVVAPEENF